MVLKLVNTKTAQAIGDRHQQVENALASVRMESLEPSVETLNLFQQYTDGELNEAELDEAFATYLSREYGSVRLSEPTVLGTFEAYGMQRV